MLRVSAALMTFVLLTGCAASGSSAPRPAEINHIVLFKLNDPADADELIRACDQNLASIPSVTSYYCGRPFDAGRENPAIDDEYDVGFYVGFEDAEAYENYVAHPAHKSLVKQWKPRFEWIRIHDVRDDTP